MHPLPQGRCVCTFEQPSLRAQQSQYYLGMQIGISYLITSSAHSLTKHICSETSKRLQVVQNDFVENIYLHVMAVL